MQLFVTPSEKREADEILARAGVDPDKKPLIMLNPGAQYGASKCWPPEYFAELADRLIDERGAQVLISSAPKERKIVDEITRRMNHAPIDLAKAGLTLGALKEIVRRCDLMISNDTGPRHIAAAFGVPVVEIYYAKERIVSVPVHCGPCQLKTCPLDHRCMTRVTPNMVFDSGLRLLSPLQVIDG
jgi:heptosyltransferase II